MNARLKLKLKLAVEEISDLVQELVSGMERVEQENIELNGRIEELENEKSELEDDNDELKSELRKYKSKDK